MQDPREDAAADWRLGSQSSLPGESLQPPSHPELLCSVPPHHLGLQADRWLPWFQDMKCIICITSRVDKGLVLSPHLLPSEWYNPSKFCSEHMALNSSDSPFICNSAFTAPFKLLFFFFLNKEIASLTEINLPIPLNKAFEALYDYDRGRYF